MKTDFTCGFIGLGLIGGSIAHAMRKFYPACHLMAWDSNDTTLARAVEDGVINDALSSPNDHLTACDYLFPLCTGFLEYIFDSKNQTISFSYLFID